MKYIVITGGVISGIGKGITSTSIGFLLQSMGYNITMIKIDPYLNVDSGTISPFEHGECFVLADGGECDLDLGNYERFLNIELTKDHNITTGKIYKNVIEKERRGDYLGATVQIVPHITDEIIDHISRVSKLPINNKIPDICIIELGGTVGDIEILPFVEAIQQMKALTDDDFCFVHVAMAICNQEVKTKPIQHSLATIRQRGIFPDLLVIRGENMISDEIKHKLRRLCQIDVKDIIGNPNVKTIYHVPAVFYSQNICDRIGKKLKLEIYPIESPYKDVLLYFENVYKSDFSTLCMSKSLDESELKSLHSIKIGIVGKYIGSPDTYLSLTRTIEHTAFYLNVNIIIEWIDSENINQDILSKCNGFIIPGGFGFRGINGKLFIAEYARENKMPILGICLGMQIMVVDCFNFFSGKKGISTEWIENDIQNTFEKVIDILPEQTGIKGGTMRLGNYDTILESSKVKDMYNASLIVERHRHRYEFNNNYIDKLGDLKCVGKSISTNGNTLVEVVELNNHPFYIGCQYHPEYISTLNKPHPLFIGLFETIMDINMDKLLTI